MNTTISFCAISDAEINRLWDKYGTPEPVRRHCSAVARQAMRLCERVNTAMEREALYAAAMLHDLVRQKKDHAREGAEVLRREGYERLAGIVAVHHDLPAKGASAEMELLALADRLVIGDRTVTLSRRFAESKKKCFDEAGRCAWAQRYAEAVGLARKYGLSDVIGEGEEYGEDCGDYNGGGAFLTHGRVQAAAADGK